MSKPKNTLMSQPEEFQSQNDIWNQQPSMESQVIHRNQNINQYGNSQRGYNQSQNPSQNQGHGWDIFGA